MADNVICYGKTEISQCQIISIEKLRIRQAINEHSELEITGIIPAEASDSCLKELKVDSPIEVKKDNITLFNGIILEIKVTCKKRLYYIYIKALSHTYKMDITKKSRSFQNENMPYSELVQSVLSGYEKGGFMDEATDSSKILKPIIQYHETDWEFLKRMASRFYTALIPNCLSESVKFYFGLPNIDKGEIQSYYYRIKKDISKYRESLQYTAGIAENDFIYIEVETDRNLNIGDTVTFNGMPMFVIENTLEETNQAIIKNTCILTFKNGAKKPRQPNRNISGCSIFGRVIATARDNVKIHLEIDENQDVSTAYWFPYATMYASEDETGWYCMPEINDSVRLYFPDDEEEKAMAINSVKPHDPNEDVEKLDPENRMANPDIKYLRTAFGKELKFRPDGIDVISKDGLVYMTLNDDGTVTLNSNDKISFSAVNDIQMIARNVNIEATDHIKIEAKGSAIDLESDITIKGKEVKTN
jgi:hypothetical protein